MLLTPPLRSSEAPVSHKKKGEGDAPLELGDSLHIFRTNIEQIYGGEPSVDGWVEPDPRAATDRIIQIFARQNSGKLSF